MMSAVLASNAGRVVLSVLLAVIILLAMICIHEFGHFIAGRLLRFKINEFSVGFGPAIFKRRGKKNGTTFAVRVIPLGGYCSFDGEEDEDDDPRSFNNKKPWQRIIVLLSGAFMNYVLAVILIIAGMFAFGQPCYKMGEVAVDEGYTAEYSLVKDDVILKAEGKTIYFVTDFMSALGGKKQGDVVTFTVLRGGEEVESDVKLRADCNFKNSSDTSKIWRAIGCDTHEGEDGNLYWSVSSENVRFGFFGTLGRSFVYSFKTAGTIFKVLGELFTGDLGLNAMGGPITTIKITSQVAIQSLQSFLQIAAYIGVNLAVFNLLPIPALDGSKVIFCLIEWIFKKPVPRKVEAVIHTVGLLLIIAFAVLVDVLQFAGC